MNRRRFTLAMLLAIANTAILSPVMADTRHVRSCDQRTLTLPDGRAAQGFFFVVDDSKRYVVQSIYHDFKPDRPMPAGMAIEVYGQDGQDKLEKLVTVDNTCWPKVEKPFKASAAETSGNFDYRALKGYFVVVRVKDQGRVYFLPTAHITREEREQNAFKDVLFEDKSDFVEVHFTVQL